MGDVELVGLYWTLSGPVEVHAGREWSLFDFGDRCEEAAKVGFSGIGITVSGSTSSSSSWTGGSTPATRSAAWRTSSGA
jgi:hypothetical protein